MYVYIYIYYNVTAQKTATLSKAKVLQRNRDSEVCHLEFPFSLKGMTFPPGSTCVGTQVSLPHLRRDQHGPGHVPIFCIGINWIDALASDLLGQCQELIRFCGSMFIRPVAQACLLGSLAGIWPELIAFLAH